MKNKQEDTEIAYLGKQDLSPYSIAHLTVPCSSHKQLQHLANTVAAPIANTNAGGNAKYLFLYICTGELKIAEKNPESLSVHFNPIALKTAKTLWRFGLSECNWFNKQKTIPPFWEKVSISSSLLPDPIEFHVNCTCCYF